jgi:hypothetical protein
MEQDILNKTRFNIQFPKNGKGCIEVSDGDAISCIYLLVATEQHKDVVLFHFQILNEPEGGWKREIVAQEKEICRD